MFEVIISKSIKKKIRKLHPYSKKIIECLHKLRENPFPLEKYDVKKLNILNQKVYRIRIGKVRIVYTVEFKTRIIRIEDIDVRKKIYK